MNTNLAYLVSQVTDKDGYLDRKQLYEALRVDPSDPVSVIIEAFLATEQSRQKLKEDISEEHEAAEGALRRIAEDIASTAEEHGKTLSAAVDEIRTARETTERAVRGHLQAVSDQSDTLNTTASKVEKAADILRTQSRLIFFSLGILVGAALALGAVFLLLGKLSH